MCNMLHSQSKESARKRCRINTKSKKKQLLLQYAYEEQQPLFGLDVMDILTPNHAKGCK